MATNSEQKNKRYWCLSTSAHNWEICKTHNLWGMDARYYVTLKNFLKSGDQAVVYVHGGKFVAVIEFLGEFFYEEKDLGWRKGKEKYLFPYRIKFKICHETKTPLQISYSLRKEKNRAKWVNPNFIDNISFIADKSRTWNQYLQVSIIIITKEDFNIIRKEIIKRK